MATNNICNEEDETKIIQTRGDASSLAKYLQVMNSYGREIIFVVALIFTGIAALQNGPLKTKKINPPELFFTPPSLITDFYHGDFDSLWSLLQEKDVSLITFYAPWDAASLQVREEIETVAKFYHNEVFFAAINCWWPEGECSKKFNPFHSYPVIMAQIHKVGSVIYEGPLISTYIISFLDSILMPLVPLHHSGELLDLLTKHEGVLVGYFEFKNNSYPKGYKQFYSTSLKALAHDPGRKVCFAVITNKKDASDFNLKADVQLYLWNSTIVYHGEINQSDILKWLHGKLYQATQWISPTGAKSRILSGNIEKQPALILFTPRNLLLDYSPYYYLFKEIAMDYNNCNKSSKVEALIHRMVLKRHIFQEDLSKMIHKCRRSNSEYDIGVQPRANLCDLTCCQTLNFDLKFHHACHCRACLHHVVQSFKDMKLSECENTLSLVLKNFDINELKSFGKCNDIEVSFPVKFGPFKQLSFHCEKVSTPAHPVKAGLTDKDIADLKDDFILTMIENNEKRLCHRLSYALNYSELNFPSFPALDNSSKVANFTGLGCQTNKTLSFIAMDAVVYHSFAENLGIDVSKNNHQTAAVIVEASQESQYVLDDIINKNVLVEFIKNFTAGDLSRYLRMPIRKLPDCKTDGDSNICLEEVTTSTFDDIVLNDKKDVVLLYYASWCGPCYSISHMFLSVADYFSNVDEIKFARISGEDNDLPWEYTVDKYPTIVFFPAKRKSESVEFPSNLMITVTNLLHFVLIHTQTKVRWNVAMQMCNRDCVAHNLIMSSKELGRLYREHRILLNNLHFVQKIVNTPKKLKKTTNVKEPNMNYLKSVYINDVISHIFKKRVQIKQALQLQSVLRKKRDIYLRDAKNLNWSKDSMNQPLNMKDSTKRPKHFDLRHKRDEL